MSNEIFINKYVVSYTRSDGEHESFITKSPSIGDIFPVLELGMRDAEFSSLVITFLGKQAAILPDPKNNTPSKYM